MSQSSLSPRSKTRWWRLGWLLLFMLLLGLQVAGLPNRYREALESPRLPLGGQQESPAEARLALEGAGFPARAYAIFEVISDAFGGFMKMAFGLLIFWRRPGDIRAQLIATLLMVGSPNNAGVLLNSFGYIGIWTSRLLILIGALSYTLLFFLFPDARFIPRWTRWVVLLTTLIFTPAFLFPGNPFDFREYSGLMFFFMVPFFISVIYSLIYRYRRVSGPLERQQTRWAIAGLVALPVAWSTEPILGLFFPQLFEIRAEMIWPRLLIDLFYFQPLYLLFPIGIGIGLLRYRLYDLDLIIRRTLVYGSLTLALGAVYLGGVVVLQSTFRPLTGDSSAALVVSTILIAALFNPLRLRIQSGIDRRFYRKKYDAEKALETFAARARSETDLEQLMSHLVTAVGETVQPEKASVWLVRTEADRQGRKAA